MERLNGVQHDADGQSKRICCAEQNGCLSLSQPSSQNAKVNEVRHGERQRQEVEGLESD